MGLSILQVVSVILASLLAYNSARREKIAETILWCTWILINTRR